MPRQNTAAKIQVPNKKYFIEPLSTDEFAVAFGFNKEHLNNLIQCQFAGSQETEGEECKDMLWNLECVFQVVLRDYLSQPDIGLKERLKGKILTGGSDEELENALEWREKTPERQLQFALVFFQEEGAPSEYLYYLFLPTFREDVDEAIRNIKANDRVTGMITLDVKRIIEKIISSVTILKKADKGTKKRKRPRKA